MSDKNFQQQVKPWLDQCFGAEIAANKIERNHRFLEEALELVQSNGCTANEAHQLVDYVYGRDVGEINQEVGGVMVTLAALCLASGVNMHTAGDKELARVWTRVEQIRAKQAAKSKHSPLPQIVETNTDLEQGIAVPCTDDTPIKMIYTNYRGKSSVRTIVPVSVFWGATAWHPEPCWLLKAYDLDKHGHRDFALADTNFAQISSVYQCGLDEGMDDKNRIDFLHNNYFDLRCFPVPTGAGDADIGWQIISHHMAEPATRIEAENFTDDPRRAIDAAIRAHNSEQSK